ncbi:MAG: tellurite resistance TerB family protein [Alphaproteobacteria bacterium]
MISSHAALIYTMVLVSAADNDMTDAELRTIGEIVNFLPIFSDYSLELLPTTARACAELLEQSGLEDALGLIRTSLEPRLWETAYAIACDVAVADGRTGQEELRLLELLRHHLSIDALVAAAIERGARARHLRLTE